jgi:DNA-binding MarR family transcriptional regulator
MVKHFSRLDRRQKHFMNSALQSSGIRGIMYKLIITIKRHPGTSQDFLADFYSVDKSNIARLVRKLEKMGHISRSVNENDRRYIRLFLTGEGERLYDTIQRALIKWGTFISKDIPAENILVTTETVEKMIDNASSM